MTHATETARVWAADELRADRVAAVDSYVEFLRVPALSGGLYALATGEADTQEPHTEDEVYVVLRGSADFTCGDLRRRVGPGDTLYVPARAEHRFVDITDDLEVLVFFAPAEYTNA